METHGIIGVGIQDSVMAMDGITIFGAHLTIETTFMEVIVMHTIMEEEEQTHLTLIETEMEITQEEILQQLEIIQV